MMINRSQRRSKGGKEGEEGNEEDSGNVSINKGVEENNQMS